MGRDFYEEPKTGSSGYYLIYKGNTVNILQTPIITSGEITLENFDLRLESYFNQLDRATNIKSYLGDKYLSEIDLKKLSQKLSLVSGNTKDLFRFESHKDPRQALIYRSEGIIDSVVDGIKRLIQWVADFFSRMFGGSKSGGNSSTAPRIIKAEITEGETIKTEPDGPKVMFNPGHLSKYFSFKDEHEAIQQVKNLEKFLTKPEGLKPIVKDFFYSDAGENVIGGVKQYFSKTSDGSGDGDSSWKLSDNFKIVFKLDEYGSFDFKKISSKGDCESFETKVTSNGSENFGTVLSMVDSKIKILVFNTVKKAEEDTKMLSNNLNGLKGSSEVKATIRKKVNLMKQWSQLIKIFDIIHVDLNVSMDKIEGKKAA